MAVKGPAEDVEKPPVADVVDTVSERPVEGARVDRSTVIGPAGVPADVVSLDGLKLRAPVVELTVPWSAPSPSRTPRPAGPL